MSKPYTFPMVLLDEFGRGYIQIPIYGSDEYCTVRWAEEESVEDLFIRHIKGGEHYPHCVYQRIFIYGNQGNDFASEYVELTIYEITCCKTTAPYFWCVLGEFSDPSDIYGSICVPYNTWNIKLLVKEFLAPFSNTNIIW